MHYVYLLRCADDSLYCGETPDLTTRERDHNEGRGGSYTSQRRPVRIVRAERFDSRSEALSASGRSRAGRSRRRRLSYVAIQAVSRVGANTIDPARPLPGETG